MEQIIMTFIIVYSGYASIKHATLILNDSEASWR